MKSVLFAYDTREFDVFLLIVGHASSAVSQNGIGTHANYLGCLTVYLRINCIADNVLRKAESTDLNVISAKDVKVLYMK
jgi:hypothetical protein